MKFRATGYLLGIILSFFGSQAHAAIIHESATIGPTGVPATNLGVLVVSAIHYLGSRFSITSPTQVTAIGGHFVQINPPGNGLIFGAIVEVPGTATGDFPSFLPAQIGANNLALTTLALPTPTSNSVIVPLSVLLPVGDYALIFGSGNSGAGGNGEMTNNNFPVGAINPNPPSLFEAVFAIQGATGGWLDLTNDVPQFYFVVEGTVVPIPPAFGLFAAGLLALGFIVRRRRRAI